MISAEQNKKALQNLLAKANAATGKSDTTITAGVNSLVNGYGNGDSVPAWDEDYILTDDTEEIVGECTHEHVIEVDVLPTDSAAIDKNALYKCGDSYHKYAEEFKDLIVVNGQPFSFVDVITALDSEIIFELYYVHTKPTENIVISGTSEDDALLALYYVKDQNDIFMYGDFEGNGTNQWLSFGEGMIQQDLQISFGGAIIDISQATQNNTMYALVNVGWTEYLVPSGSVTITENSTVDVTDKAKVVVNVPIPDGYIIPSGAKMITGNGPYDVTQFAAVEVEVPDPPLPIEVATESEMNALLETAEVGSVYKYVGTTGTYENSALYRVEAVSE